MQKNKKKKKKKKKKEITNGADINDNTTAAEIDL